MDKCLKCGKYVIENTLFCSKYCYREYKREIIDMINKISDQNLAMIRAYVYSIYSVDKRRGQNEI